MASDRKGGVGYGLQLSSVLAGIYWERTLCFIVFFSWDVPYPETPDVSGSKQPMSDPQQRVRHHWGSWGCRSLQTVLHGRGGHAQSVSCCHSTSTLVPHCLSGLVFGNSDQALTAGFPKLSKHLISSRPGIKLREERISVVSRVQTRCSPDPSSWKDLQPSCGSERVSRWPPTASSSAMQAASLKVMPFPEHLVLKTKVEISGSAHFTEPESMGEWCLLHGSVRLASQFTAPRPSAAFSSLISSMLIPRQQFALLTSLSLLAENPIQEHCWAEARLGVLSEILRLFLALSEILLLCCFS